MTDQGADMGVLSDAYRGVGTGGRDPAELALRQVTEAELIRAIEAGTVVNAGGDPATIEEIPADEDVSGRYPDLESQPPLVTAALDGSTLRTVLLRYAGKSRGDVEYDPRGLRLERVLITGESNWSWLDLPFPVGFWGCAFPDFFMTVDHAHVPRLVFDACWFGSGRWAGAAFNAAETRISSAIRFLDCEGLRQLFLLDCELATFELRDHPGSVADGFRLVLTGSTIGEFIVQGDSPPAEMIPAKDNLDGIQLQQLKIWSWDDRQDQSDKWKARWIGEWLAGGAVPHALRGRRTDRAALNPHRRQVWAEFAAALDRDHLEDAATALRISAERHRDATRLWIVRAVRWLTLDLTVRYFYRNLRALGWLAVVWLTVTAISWANMGQLYRDGTGAFGPDPLTAGADGVLWAVAYGLDIVVSPLALGFDAVWPTAPVLIVVFAVLKLLAIGLFGLFIIGITGVVQRSRG